MQVARLAAISLSLGVLCTVGCADILGFESRESKTNIADSSLETSGEDAPSSDVVSPDVPPPGLTPCVVEIPETLVPNANSLVGFMRGAKAGNVVLAWFSDADKDVLFSGAFDGDGTRYDVLASPRRYTVLTDSVRLGSGGGNVVAMDASERLLYLDSTDPSVLVPLGKRKLIGGPSTAEDGSIVEPTRIVTDLVGTRQIESIVNGLLQEPRLMFPNDAITAPYGAHNATLSAWWRNTVGGWRLSTHSVADSTTNAHIELAVSAVPVSHRPLAIRGNSAIHIAYSVGSTEPIDYFYAQCSLIGMRSCVSTKLPGKTFGLDALSSSDPAGRFTVLTTIAADQPVATQHQLFRFVDASSAAPTRYVLPTATATTDPITDSLALSLDAETVVVALVRGKKLFLGRYLCK